MTNTYKHIGNLNKEKEMILIGRCSTPHDDHIEQEKSYIDNVISLNDVMSKRAMRPNGYKCNVQRATINVHSPCR